MWENKGLRILVKCVYEQNKLIIMWEFVNMNISREVCDRPCSEYYKQPLENVY